MKYVVIYALTSPPRDILDALFGQWNAEDREKFEADADARCAEFWEPLRHAGLWDDLALSERDLAETTIVTMDAQQQVNATWRLEAAQVLMWALGLVPRLPPFDTQANHDLLKQIPTGGIRRFVSSVCLRSEQEIDQARDDAELWHWRSRTRQLVEDGDEFPASDQLRAAGFNTYDDIVRVTARNLAEEGRIQATIGEDFPAKGKAYRKLSAVEWSVVRSITMERHFALNWLCGFAPDNKWDETPTDT
ncbi:MAG: DUF4272 domain-containing protein [Pirellulales bacterium]|nr:DUF4272 domain-containing protein [Pirellulales bacterium]